MKTERLTVEIMAPDKRGNGGIKITQRGKVLKWFYHNCQTATKRAALKKRIIRAISKLKGVS